jgi:hypothetical protein
VEHLDPAPGAGRAAIAEPADALLVVAERGGVLQRVATSNRGEAG